jgi:hypothetical protein
MSIAHPYSNARFALLTQHGKETIVAPLFRERLAATVDRVTGFDTDSLGTFTREVPRYGTQLEAARRKANLACELGATDLGLGSEGAFGPSPLGFGTWNHELVVLVDRRRQVEIVGRASGPGLHGHGRATSLDELRGVAHRCGFPEHGLVLRPDHEDDPRARKGIHSSEELAVGFEASLRQSESRVVFVETDLRAHHHPGRRARIAKATLDLLGRVAHCCPQCECPGMGALRAILGRPCAECDLPTLDPVADELGCVQCDYREVRVRPGPERADPSRCERCNP